MKEDSNYMVNLIITNGDIPINLLRVTSYCGYEWCLLHGYELQVSFIARVRSYFLAISYVLLFIGGTLF